MLITDFYRTFIRSSSRISFSFITATFGEVFFLMFFNTVQETIARWFTSESMQLFTPEQGKACAMAVIMTRFFIVLKPLQVVSPRAVFTTFVLATGLFALGPLALGFQITETMTTKEFISKYFWGYYIGVIVLAGFVVDFTMVLQERIARTYIRCSNIDTASSPFRAIALIAVYPSLGIFPFILATFRDPLQAFGIVSAVLYFVILLSCGSILVLYFTSRTRQYRYEEISEGPSSDQNFTPLEIDYFSSFRGLTVVDWVLAPVCILTGAGVLYVATQVWTGLIVIGFLSAVALLASFTFRPAWFRLPESSQTEPSRDLPYLAKLLFLETASYQALNLIKAILLMAPVQMKGFLPYFTSQRLWMGTMPPAGVLFTAILFTGLWRIPIFHRFLYVMYGNLSLILLSGLAMLGITYYPDHCGLPASFFLVWLGPFLIGFFKAFVIAETLSIASGFLLSERCYQLVFLFLQAFIPLTGQGIEMFLSFDDISGQINLRNYFMKVAGFLIPCVALTGLAYRFVFYSQHPAHLVDPANPSYEYIWYRSSRATTTAN